MNVRILSLRWWVGRWLVVLCAVGVVAVPAATADEAADDMPLGEPARADNDDNNGVTATLWQQLRDRRATVRARAFEELAELGEAVVPELIARIDDADMRVRLACVQLLARLSPAEALVPLIARLDDEAEAVRERARVELLDLPVENLAERVGAEAQRWLEVEGYTPLGLDRLLLALRLRQILHKFEVWRTAQMRTGLRFPNQYAYVLRDRPEAAAVLLEFVRNPAISDEELGEGWSRGEALVAAVRSLADAEERPEGAQAAIAELLRTMSSSSGSHFMRMVPTDGSGSEAAVISVAQMALFRMGSDEGNVARLLESWESSLARHPHASTAQRLASIYIELGESALALRYLRIAVNIERAAGNRSGTASAAQMYLQLAALTLEELAQLEAAGIDPEEVFEDPQLDAELRRIRPGQQMILRPGQAPVPDLDRLALPDEPISEDLAMRHLRDALEAGFSDAQWLSVDPRLERLRQRDEFNHYVELLQRIYPVVGNNDQ